MKRLSESQQAQWLVAIKERGGGWGAAMQSLYDAYRPLLLRRFRGKGFAVSEAEDLLHDLMMRVVERAGQFTATEESCVSAWIHTIGTNLMADRWRARAREMRLGDDEDPPNEDAADDRLEVASVVAPLGQDGRETSVAAAREAAIVWCVRAALRRFGRHHPAVADALNLAALEGWSMKSLAQFIGRNPGATREFVHQGRKKLHPYLKPCRALLDE